MGIGRLLHRIDLKKDLKMIELFSKEAKDELKVAVHHAEGLVELQLNIPADDILELKNYHVVENKGWAKAPLLINTQLRIPLLKRMNAGDESSVSMYFGVSVILHSIRAIFDFEFNQNKKLIFLCQKLWYEFSSDDIENIPARFRGDV